MDTNTRNSGKKTILIWIYSLRGRRNAKNIKKINHTHHTEKPFSRFFDLVYVSTSSLCLAGLKGSSFALLLSQRCSASEIYRTGHAAFLSLAPLEFASYPVTALHDPSANSDSPLGSVGRTDPRTRVFDRRCTVTRKMSIVISCRELRIT